MKLCRSFRRAAVGEKCNNVSLVSSTEPRGAFEPPFRPPFLAAKTALPTTSFLGEAMANYLSAVTNEF
ncbi:MAG: hypothetical protein AAGI23_08295 [Bacteroidota bacterium]